MFKLIQTNSPDQRILKNFRTLGGPSRRSGCCTPPTKPRALPPAPSPLQRQLQAMQQRQEQAQQPQQQLDELMKQEAEEERAREQRLRDDAVTEHDKHELYQRGAPATEAGLYLVPKVIE